MKCKRKHRVKLTAFGKIFFSFIFLIIASAFFLFRDSNNKFYEKEETKKYTIEIEYPKLRNKSAAEFTKNYINEKKQEFIKEIEELEDSNNFQYEFKTSYEINENPSSVGIHLTVMEYTGGAHYIRDDKSYYYDKSNEKIITINDFLINDNSLDKLANLSYYYVMKYSQENSLGFDEEMAMYGLESNQSNFEHFKFTDEGLEFVFPPYQVAYYAAGEVHITIPYAELKGIIKDEYIKDGLIAEEIPSTTNRDLNKFMDKKLIAFTFDDGPSYQTTNKLLDNLEKYDARVTFFVLGNRVQKYADTLKKAYDMGNLIGSHTYSHKNLFKLNKFQLIREIRDANDSIKNIIGHDVLYLRPPYGNINANIKEEANMYTILWDLDTEDWKYKDRNKISNYIIENAHDGAIVLLHDLYETSVDGALDAMEKLRDQGYAFVTIEEMTLIKNIKLNQEKSYYNFKI